MCFWSYQIAVCPICPDFRYTRTPPGKLNHLYKNERACNLVAKNCDKSADGLTCHAKSKTSNNIRTRKIWMHAKDEKGKPIRFVEKCALHRNHEQNLGGGADWDSVLAKALSEIKERETEAVPIKLVDQFAQDGVFKDNAIIAQTEMRIKDETKLETDLCWRSFMDSLELDIPLEEWLRVNDVHPT